MSPSACDCRNLTSPGSGELLRAPSAPVRRVLMTADTVGGVWTYALELARALGEHGVEVVLATMGQPLDQGQRADAASLRSVTVAESTYKLEWMEEPWADVQAAGDWLLALEEQARPDIIHLNGYAHGALPWRAPTVVVGHSCVYSWFAAVRGGPPPASWQRYAREVRRGLRRAGAVTAPSRAMLEALARHYGPFAAAACATPLITDNWRGLDTFFMPGREILVSSSPAQTLRYLREMSEAERVRLGRRARLRVLAQHTAAHRAAELERHVLDAFALRTRSRRYGAAR